MADDVVVKTTATFVEGFKDNWSLKSLEIGRRLKRRVVLSQSTRKVNNRYTVRSPYIVSSFSQVTRPSRNVRRFAFRFPDGHYELVDSVTYDYTSGWTEPATHFVLGTSRGTVKADALSRLYGKIVDQKVNLAMFFAERQSALDMIADKATRIFNAYRNVRRGNVRRAMRNLGISNGKVPRSKQASGQWLELQYGWLPLVSDIYGLAQLPGIDIPVSVRGRATQVLSGKTRTGPGFHRRVIKAQWLADMKISSTALAYANNLGLINPATVAWELVPFSFVLDWFLPVGDYLDSLTAKVGVNLSNISYTEKVVDTVEVDSGMNRMFFSYESSQLTRSVHSSIPSAPLPSFQNPLSPTRLANAVALGRQLKRS